MAAPCPLPRPVPHPHDHAWASDDPGSGAAGPGCPAVPDSFEFLKTFFFSFSFFTFIFTLGCTCKHSGPAGLPPRSLRPPREPLSFAPPGPLNKPLFVRPSVRPSCQPSPHPSLPSPLHLSAFLHPELPNPRPTLGAVLHLPTGGADPMRTLLPRHFGALFVPRCTLSPPKRPGLSSRSPKAGVLQPHAPEAPGPAGQDMGVSPPPAGRNLPSVLGAEPRLPGGPAACHSLSLALPAAELPLSPLPGASAANWGWGHADPGARSPPNCRWDKNHRCSARPGLRSDSALPGLIPCRRRCFRPPVKINN